MSNPAIQVLEVDITEEVAGFERVRIQQPVTGAKLPGYSLRVAGFAIPRSSALQQVDVTFRYREGGTMHRVHRMPALEGNNFNGSFTVLGLERECTLAMRAKLEDGSAGMLGSLTLRRRPLETGFEPSLDPLLLICEGRSGSTWLAHLLGCHPRVVAFEPFRFEPRVSSYWANVLRTLANPMSYSQSLQPQFAPGLWWTGEERSAPAAELGFDEGSEELLARDSVEHTAAFCQQQIERFYGRVAEEQSKTGARFFTERGHAGGWFTGPLIRELYPRAHQIFLVRDFRDVVCSMLAHNAKTGRPSFGRLHAQTDEEFVRDVLAGRVGRLLEAWDRRGPDAALVRYEELMLEPERALGALLESIGLESDQDTLRETLQRALAGRRDRQADHMTASDQAASVGRWREELSPSLQQISNDALAGALEAFGYA